MRILSLLVLLLSVYVRGSLQQTNETHYIAAVVEFNGLSQSGEGLSPDYIVNNNSKAYQDIILSNEAKIADIIVFPESTLNGLNEPLTYVPRATDKISPCDLPSNYEPFLVEISCRARESKKYVVINLTEKEDCTKKSQADKKDPRPCASNGLSIFNTNVVFDRTGAVISTYRKVHLFGEDGTNTTYVPDYSTFTTDFNVTFGHFICFDILFQTPAQDLADRGITDFIYPTMWFSELPFLTAVQTQMAWAYGNDVNLLAANSGEPKVGSTGTGIYAGRDGIITAAVNDDPIRKIYVATVPKKINAKRPYKPFVIPPTGSKSTDKILIIVDNSIQNFTTKIIDSEVNEAQIHNVCSKEFCCKFNVTKQSKSLVINEKGYQFRVGAYNDFRSFQGIDETYLRICGLFACQNSSLSSCGATFNTRSEVPVTDYFENIEIEAKYPKKNKMLIQPTSVQRDLLPIPAGQFEFNVKKTGQFYEAVVSTTNRSDLLSFAIIANYYENSAGFVISSLLVVLVSSSISLFL